MPSASASGKERHKQTGQEATPTESAADKERRGSEVGAARAAATAGNPKEKERRTCIWVAATTQGRA